MLKHLHYIPRFFVYSLFLFLFSCEHDDDNQPASEFFDFVNARLDQRNPATIYRDVSLNPVVRLSFSEPVDRGSAPSAIALHPANATSIPVTLAYENNDSI